MYARAIALSFPFLLTAGLSARGATNDLSAADRMFLTSTAQGAMYELALAHLALKKTSRDDIENYAKTIIADHSRLNPRLLGILRRNELSSPRTMKAEDRASYDHLKGLKGSSFDRAFTQVEAKDNQDDVATEQKEIASTSDATIRSFVEQVRMADEHHAEIGKSLDEAGQ